MSKPVAKAKRKRQQQEEAEAMADAAVKKTRVVQMKDRQANTDVTVKEIRNVISGSFERLWEELNATRGMTNVSLQAEHAADFITGSLTHGIHKFGPPVKIREHEFEPPYCREHKR
jgi:hypothetical protein